MNLTSRERDLLRVIQNTLYKENAVITKMDLEVSETLKVMINYEVIGTAKFYEYSFCRLALESASGLTIRNMHTYISMGIQLDIWTDSP